MSKVLDAVKSAVRIFSIRRLDAETADLCIIGSYPCGVVVQPRDKQGFAVGEAVCVGTVPRARALASCRLGA